MLRPIAIATAISGTLDILFAMILTFAFGREIPNMLRVVASGPFPGATGMGTAGAILGLVVHYVLMAIMATGLVLLVRWRPGLVQTPLRTGLASSFRCASICPFHPMRFRSQPSCSHMSCSSAFRWLLSLPAIFGKDQSERRLFSNAAGEEAVSDERDASVALRNAR